MRYKDSRFLCNTGKARKGNSNYESNDIADDDPENAKGKLPGMARMGLFK